MGTTIQRTSSRWWGTGRSSGSDWWRARIGRPVIHVCLGIVMLASLGSCVSTQPEGTNIASAPPVPLDELFASGTAPRVLFAVNDSDLSTDHQVTIASLQGLLARTETGIFRVYDDPTRLWLELLESEYGVQVDRSLQSDFPGLLARFAGDVAGYVPYTAHGMEIEYELDESLAIALTVAGPLNAIVIEENLAPLAEQAGISLAYDPRGTRLGEVVETFAVDLNQSQVIHRSFQRARSFLTDYAVMGNMINFYYPEYSPDSMRMLQFVRDNGMLLGWGRSEEGLVSMTSEQSVVVQPADWANNLSVLSSVPAIARQTEPVEDAGNDDVHTVTFLITDGDNVQWTTGGFATDERWYGSEFRGRLNLGWTINPSLSRLAPPVLKYFYDNAASSESGRDYFVAGPSGYGYIYPDIYPDIDGYTAVLNELMAEADLSIVNIIQRYGRNLDYLDSYLSRENIDAVFLYNFDYYAGGAGQIQWVNGKPVISARSTLWAGQNSAESLASALNDQPRDNSSPDGYSLIAVHAWSQTVEDVYRCIALLDPAVDVVTPDVFVERITRNVRRR